MANYREPSRMRGTQRRDDPASTGGRDWFGALCEVWERLAAKAIVPSGRLWRLLSARTSRLPTARQVAGAAALWPPWRGCFPSVKSTGSSRRLFAALLLLLAFCIRLPPRVF
jgi:hypothetical protein